MPPCADNVTANITADELESLLKHRIRRIFEIASSNEIEVLILGAFGCRAFKSPPEIAAKLFHDIMQDFLHHFETIEYAVSLMDHEVANYDAFIKIMG